MNVWLSSSLISLMLTIPFIDTTSIDIRHVVKPRGSVSLDIYNGTGTILLFGKNNNSPLYRVRIIGQIITMATCNTGPRHLCRFDALPAGVYFAEILQLHPNYTVNTPTTMFEFLLHAKFAFNVSINLPHIFYPHWSINCKLNHAASISTCIYPKHLLDGCLSRSVEPSCLEWKGLINSAAASRAAAPACIHTKTSYHICIIGDSHSRVLVSTLNNRLQRGYQQFTKANKSFLQSETVKYYHDTYGNELIHLNLQYCTHVIVNYANWPLSGPTPWSNDRYASQLQMTSSTLLHLQNASLRVGWFLAPGFPPRSKDSWRHLGDHPYDWRSDVTLKMFNDIARKIMSLKNIPVLDFWSPSYPVSDLSGDGAHFEGGPVSDVFADLIFDFVCAGS